MIGPVHLIFYVADQVAATAFWQGVLDCPPALEVPGMTELSPLTRRSWGDDAAYCLDPDGHVVAFATRPGGDHGPAESTER